MRVWLPALLAAALVVGGAAVAALLAWPAGAVGASTTGLATVDLPAFAGRVRGVSVVDAHGRQVPVVLRGDTVWPRRRLSPGVRLTVTTRIRRPAWIGWLVGREVVRRTTLVTPLARLRSTLLRPRPGAAVRAEYDMPVSRIAVGHGRGRRLAPGRASVPLGVVARGRARAGTTTVAAAARPWEALSKPVRVSWFVAGRRPQAVAAPAVGGPLAPDGTLTLTFSEPVSALLGARRPRLEPAVRGRWRVTGRYTLSFRPAGFGFGLGGTVRLRLPRPVVVGGRVTRLVSWRVPTGSTLRLQQLLAQLGYLPLRWRPAAPPATDPRAEVAAAVSPPRGVFSWRYPNTPAPLRALWSPGRWNVVTEGAVMRFEDEHGLATDGVAGPQVWRALLRDERAGRRSPNGYSYVFVHETVPESLNLWHDGRIILTSPGNTGIPQAPTAPGTWPVFEHIPVGTMSGTNPDGSHYDDPGVRWISYFHGGDAIHAFPRASYGTPQSLGCVELPFAAAERVWPYTPVGTLVTVEP